MRHNAFAAIATLVTAMLATLTTVRMAANEMGEWKAYMAYYTVQDICAADNYLFVKASYSLYQYNKNDGSIYTYDKTNGMSDTRIMHIGWNSTAKKLVVAYDDSNIDLVETNGNVTNVADLYNRTMTEDKTINIIKNEGKYAYIGTNFGVVKVNVAAAEISETYMLGLEVTRIGFANGYIFVNTRSGLRWKASLDSNLMDSGNWSRAYTGQYPTDIFDLDTSDYDNNIDLVETLSPGGPAYNNFGYLRMYNGKLYACNGYSDIVLSATLQVYDGNDWTLYEDDITEETGHRFVNLHSCAIDPSDEGHVFAAGRSGLYEYENGRFVKEYSNDNSPLRTAATLADSTDKDYVFVMSVEYTSDGHLWVTNSRSSTNALYEVLPDGTWIAHGDSRLMVTSSGVTCSMECLEDIMFDSRGRLWMVNNYWNSPALIRYDTDTEAMDVCLQAVNQNATTLNISFFDCPTEDREGNIWVGTTAGPMYVASADAATMGSSDFTFVQPLIPRNDGTNLADYLLDNIEVVAIAVDGANRKWFGTSENGVYLISADNMEQLQHFTSDNSPLLSNDVRAIAINQETGEVFFGTDQGLCSYTSDATEPSTEMTKDNVYAYPNPVRPGYTGLITVVGLTFDADVKITTATGALVAEGRSSGGTFTWDGCDSKGRRVASGVYNVVTATSDGGKGTVCKVAIVR